MVPGQSVILYSRLHLVSRRYELPHFIRYLIIVIGITLCILTTISNFVSVYNLSPTWNQEYNVVEPLQLAYFCAQEYFISVIYVAETVKLESR
jgi:hypothetical protein